MESCFVGNCSEKFGNRIPREYLLCTKWIAHKRNQLCARARVREIEPLFCSICHCILVSAFSCWENWKSEFKHSKQRMSQREKAVKTKIVQNKHIKLIAREFLWSKQKNVIHFNFWPLCIFVDRMTNSFIIISRLTQWVGWTVFFPFIYLALLCNSVYSNYLNKPFEYNGVLCVNEMSLNELETLPPQFRWKWLQILLH